MYVLIYLFIYLLVYLMQGPSPGLCARPGCTTHASAMQRQLSNGMTLRWLSSGKSALHVNFPLCKNALFPEIGHKFNHYPMWHSYLKIPSLYKLSNKIQLGNYNYLYLNPNFLLYRKIYYIVLEMIILIQFEWN